LNLSKDLKTKGKSSSDAQKEAQTLILLGHELASVVTVSTVSSRFENGCVREMKLLRQ
jgi:hypothetical protein